MTLCTQSSHGSSHPSPLDGDSIDGQRSSQPLGTEDFPEGGLKGWLCVFGSFMGFFGSFGLVNSMGVLEAYLSTHQLSDYAAGQTGWIFGVLPFLTLFFGAQVGPVFDAKGPKVLLLAGSTLIMMMMISIGFCSTYWQFMLSIGVCGGTGISLVFTPTLSAVSHFFFARRGMATGIAASGGGVGGVCFTLMYSSLVPRIGFPCATRAVALLCLVSLILANILVSSRLPRKSSKLKVFLPDFRIFSDKRYFVMTIACFFIEWGLFIPISYLISYTLRQGSSTTFSYQVLAILNAGSCVGRWVPGYVSDRMGRMNTLIVTVFLCIISNACLWLPAGSSTALIVIYAAIFGFASGGNISLVPVCIGQLCDTKNYGRYFATSYTIVSLR